jgi:hypothetical protein
MTHLPRTSFRLMPNPSLKLTRYGRHCKPGLRGQLSSNGKPYTSSLTWSTP